MRVLALALLATLCITLSVAGCSGGGGGGGVSGAPAVTTSATTSTTTAPTGPSTTVVGKVSDATGTAVGGALVVVGASSATGVSDATGDFSVSGAPTGPQPLLVLAPGYRVQRATTNGGPIVCSVADDADTDSSPIVGITSMGPDPAGGVAITAMVQAAPGATITDVRAEVLGTQDGAVLTRNGNAYSGTVTLTQRGGVMLVFAVDDQGRHGQDARDLGTPPAPSSASGNAESWVGSVYGVHRTGYNSGIYPLNLSLAVTPQGNASGVSVGLRGDLLAQSQSPIDTSALSGGVRKTGPVYRARLDLDGQTGLMLHGYLSSDGGEWNGLVAGMLDGKPYHGRFRLVNTNVRANPFTTQSLAGTWGLSYRTAGGTGYQANMLPSVDNLGSVLANGPVTLGTSTAAGGTLAFTQVQGLDLGYVTGSPCIVLSDSSQFTMHGLTTVDGRRISGVFSGASTTGRFWGRSNAVWSAANFSASWRGRFFVSSGPDAGNQLLGGVSLDASGNVTGTGGLFPAAGSTLQGGPIAIQGGGFTMTSPNVGGITGSLTGSQNLTAVTINMSTPTAPETASMGVNHEVMVGKFSISSNGDAGVYVLQRGPLP